MSLNIPKCGNVFGSILEISFNFSNNSPAITKFVNISLAEEVEYFGMKNERKMETNVTYQTKTIQDPENKNSYLLEISEPFKPSRLPLCSLIKVLKY